MGNFNTAFLILGDQKLLWFIELHPQWFISMEKNNLRKKALKAIDDTAFYPARGKGSN